MQSLSIQPVMPIRSVRPSAAGLSREQSLQALSQVASVRVRADAAGADAYAVEVEVYRVASPAIPQAEAGASPSLSSDPPDTSKLVLRAARSFARFFDLQTQLQRCTRLAHSAVPCEFCREVNSAAVWGGPHSSALAVLAMDQVERALAFENSVSGVLHLTRTCFSSKHRGGPCSAQVEVPAVLLAFLSS